MDRVEWPRGGSTVAQSQDLGAGCEKAGALVHPIDWLVVDLLDIGVALAGTKHLPGFLAAMRRSHRRTNAWRDDLYVAQVAL